ncbi:MAG: hypothetical protein ACI84O_000335 [Myxococcota bacterium]|jgi:hypothetical protein
MMSETSFFLIMALLTEMLIGLGLENESMAARGRIEVSRRCVERCEQRVDYNDSLFNQITSPSNLQRLIEEQHNADLDNNRS